NLAAETSGGGLAAGVEPRLEGAAQQLARHVAGPARDPLWLHPDDADYFAAAVAVAVRVRIRLADGGGLVSPPSEKRPEPREHDSSVAETRLHDYPGAATTRAFGSGERFSSPRRRTRSSRLRPSRRARRARRRRGRRASRRA